ncbi:uncharacterized protein EDB91DRAFT_1061494 [Suillus paluster]|uniref:uncharacterized protein n=1 Tax=Suillus paluster TaxID=48578 RepID=UPI001B8607F7|nr:uncharacterized protein EDB91DRAFT_1061494 [Suillus paluster]KAG1726711.1 hypothetical protein EDB91DRAFT_1061494 [Suillus paluster]
MLRTLPAPVLSVTPDAVKGLQGQDALSALWTIFTKCKESQPSSRFLLPPLPPPALIMKL